MASYTATRTIISSLVQRDENNPPVKKDEKASLLPPASCLLPPCTSLPNGTN
ncbi:MAG: hypothetical protein F6K41_38765 [Symploca sp. SIO3E6]|nr:hypothetical protein [Caldora sp. SIO3E6]